MTFDLRNIDQNEVRRELARKRFHRYVAFTTPWYRFSWFHLAISQVLEDFALGRRKRVMLFAPPRHGKSQQASRHLPGFIFGNDPDAEIIATSYASDLANAMSRDAKKLIADEPYRELFPDIRLSGKGVQSVKGVNYANTDELWEIVDKRGSYRAAGVGGGITGRGATHLLIDDPFKDWQEAKSPTTRKAVWDWYTSTAQTRLQKDAGVLIIQTRWHEGDLSGLLQELAEKDPTADQWDVFSFPAILEEDTDNPFDKRKIGEALWPEFKDVPQLEKIKASNIEVWNALYQQSPVPLDGKIIKQEWLKYYEQAPAHINPVVSVDASFKGNKNNDFVVIQVWTKHDQDHYLLHQVREKMGFTDTLAALKKIAKAYPTCMCWLIEDKANGSAIIDVLKKHLAGVVEVKPKESKEARLEAVAPLFQAGNVFLPKNSSWVAQYVKELLGFPAAKHDDQVDATSQYLSRHSIDAAYDLEALLTL